MHSPALGTVIPYQAIPDLRVKWASKSKPPVLDESRLGAPHEARPGDITFFIHGELDRQELPSLGGVLTPATAPGAVLRERLCKAQGSEFMRFRLLSKLAASRRRVSGRAV